MISVSSDKTGLSKIHKLDNVTKAISVTLLIACKRRYKQQFLQQIDCMKVKQYNTIQGIEV